MAELFIEIGSYEDANKYLEEAKFVGEKVPSLYQIQSFFQLTVDLKTAERKFEEALSAFRELFDAKQKIQAQESERRLELARVEHEVEQKEREAELYRVKSEQLEKELMNKTTYLISQSEMLARFKDDLKKIVVETSDPIRGLKQVREKIKDIQTETINWEEYDKTFSAVHPEFKQNLLERFSDLTPMETKVCTLLRIELTSKEIAQLLNISERSVENHRYRARKKIGLGDHENFQQFLTSL
jgi:DNA-binding CsgD family transcriptional regulator